MHADAGADELALSPDDRILVSRGFRSLCAWNLKRNAATWKRFDLDCNAFAICSSTTLVCGTNTGEIIELSLATGKTLRLLARHKTTIRHVSYAENTLVAVDGAGEAVLFRRQRGSWVRQPAEKLFSGNNRLCLSADGKQAVGTSRDNRTLLCWDLDEQEPICHMTGHKGIIINAGFLPDGSILSCGNDGTVRVWDLAVDGVPRLVTRISPLFAG
jgi:WD40 repeat protein